MNDCLWVMALLGCWSTVDGELASVKLSGWPANGVGEGFGQLSAKSTLNGLYARSGNGLDGTLVYTRKVSDTEFIQMWWCPVATYPECDNNLGQGGTGIWASVKSLSAQRSTMNARSRGDSSLLLKRTYPGSSSEKTLSAASTFYTCPLDAATACTKASSVQLGVVSFSEQMRMVGSSWTMQQDSAALALYAVKAIAAGTILRDAGFTFLSGGSDHESNPVYKAELGDDNNGIVLYLAWYQNAATSLTAGHWVIGMDTGTTVTSSPSAVGEDTLVLKMLPVLFLESPSAAPPDSDAVKAGGAKWFSFTVDGQGAMVRSNDNNAVFETASFATTTRTVPAITTTSATRITTVTTAPTAWILGSPTVDCATACATQTGGECRAEKLNALNDEQDFVEAYKLAGIECKTPMKKTCEDSSACIDWGSPYIHEDSVVNGAASVCHNGKTDGSVAGCDIKWGKHRRLCPCTTPYTGPPSTRTTTTTTPTTPTTVATTTITTTTTVVCPFAPEPCCTQLGVKGRAGYNYIVNGFYDFVGVFGGRASFKRESGFGDRDITIYWTNVDTRWTISEGVGSQLTYGYWEEDVLAGPFDAKTPATIFGEKGYDVDEDVKVWCSAGLPSTSSTTTVTTVTSKTATTTTPYTGPPTTRTTSTFTTVTTTTDAVGKCGSGGGKVHGWCDRTCDVCADDGNPNAVPFVSDHICIYARCGRTTTAYRRATTPDPLAAYSGNATYTGQSSEAKGLSGAGVAMIVIAVLALIAGPLIYLYWKSTKRKTAMPLSKTLANIAKQTRPVSVFGPSTPTTNNPSFDRAVSGLQRPISSYATPTTPGLMTPGGRPMSMLEALGGGGYGGPSTPGLGPSFGQGSKSLSMLEAISGSSDGKRADLGKSLSLTESIAPVPKGRRRKSPSPLVLGAGNNSLANVATPTGFGRSTPGSADGLLDNISEDGRTPSTVWENPASLTPAGRTRKGPRPLSLGAGNNSLANVATPTGFGRSTPGSADGLLATPSSSGVHLTPTLANGKRYSIPFAESDSPGSPGMSSGLFADAFSHRLSQKTRSPLGKGRSHLRNSQGPSYADSSSSNI